MAAIRGKHNKSTELVLRMALVRSKISGWRLQAADLPGNPDLFFKSKRLAVFVDGCFWHGCPRCGHIPKTRRLFWKTKIMRNRQRDRSTTRDLRKKGVAVLRIWEHELDSKKNAQSVIRKMKVWLANGLLD